MTKEGEEVKGVSRPPPQSVGVEESHPVRITSDWTSHTQHGEERAKEVGSEQALCASPSAASASAACRSRTLPCLLLLCSPSSRHQSERRDNSDTSCFLHSDRSTPRRSTQCTRHSATSHCTLGDCRTVKRMRTLRSDASPLRANSLPPSHSHSYSSTDSACIHLSSPAPSTSPPLQIRAFLDSFVDPAPGSLFLGFLGFWGY